MTKIYKQTSNIANPTGATYGDIVLYKDGGIKIADEDGELVGTEGGSNANGSWIKFSDGTMICYKTVAYTGTISSALGSIFLASNSGVDCGSFPVEFTAPPNLSVTITSTGGSAAWPFVGVVPTKTAIGRVNLARPVSTAAYTYYINIQAIGRWK